MTHKWFGLTTVVSLQITTTIVDCGATEGTLAIQVVDENDKGVISRVYYDDGATKPLPFWDTDEKGTVIRSHACGTTKILKAHPRDAGMYFDSEERSCAEPKVVLRVLRRQTPVGYAFSSHVLTVKLQDGSDGVITFRTALEVRRTERPRTAFGETGSCTVDMDAVVYQQAYKISESKWIAIGEAATPLSRVVPNAGQPDVQTVTFPFTCSGAEDRVAMVQSDVRARLSKTFNERSLVLNSSLQELGIPLDANRKTIEEAAVPRSPKEPLRVITTKPLIQFFK